MLRSLPRGPAEPRRDAGLRGAPGPGLVATGRRPAARGRSRNRETGGLDAHHLKAPKTSFNGRISPHRRFVFGQLSLDEVKAVKNEHGCTVNDVVVSICAGAVRRWLLEHDELPAEPLVAQIPVSVRTERADGHLRQPDHADERAALHQRAGPGRAACEKTHEALAAMKERHRALPAELLQDANHFIPPAVFARAARATFALSTSRRGRPTWNLVISNVPGPQFPLYCAGARAGRQLPGLGDHRRDGPQHHRDELLRPAWTSGSSPTATRCRTSGR